MRRSVDFTVTAEGRDKGKVFTLTEMPALQGEKWAIRALLGMTKSGVELPADVAQSGMAGLTLVGLRSLMMIGYEDLEPLLDEMMACVQRKEAAVTRPMLDGDIEEVPTIARLRAEVFELHTGFSIAAALLKLGTAARLTGEGASPPR
ncbi:MAG TPA: hypothetical protein VG248_03410 [Caulobacteraceae bacterium]|jgi:hypothetical protein|nr:hypothetical protein [Caulobacteraceae bacterium]